MYSKLNNKNGEQIHVREQQLSENTVKLRKAAN